MKSNLAALMLTASTPTSFLKNVTMVSQTTYLFDETIEDNLRIAKPDATQEEIEGGLPDGLGA